MTQPFFCIPFALSVMMQLNALTGVGSNIDDFLPGIHAA